MGDDWKRHIPFHEEEIDKLDVLACKGGVERVDGFDVVAEVENEN